MTDIMKQRLRKRRKLTEAAEDLFESASIVKVTTGFGTVARGSVVNAHLYATLYMVENTRKTAGMCLRIQSFQKDVAKLA
jgi:hypothetical protein